MKTHTNLKELLEDFISQSRQIHPTPYKLKSTGKRFVKNYLSSNSLALGKQKPLAKNKHCENSDLKKVLKCGCCGELNPIIPDCDNCGNKL